MVKTYIPKQSKNIEVLKEFGTDYMKENLFKPVEIKPEIHYNKNMLQIGRKLDGSIYALDLTEACRVLILGATRSGKTFLLREIIDRLYQTERDVLILNDCKAEFVSSLQPVQEKFQDNLLPGEIPVALPIVSLRPTFFKTISPELPKNNFWCSISMKELTKGDFLTMMNSEGLTPTQQIAMDLIYEEMHKKLDAGSDFSVPLMEEIIDSIDEISTMQKNSLKFKFKPLSESKFIENNYERSMYALFSHPKRFIPCLNMENFDSFGKTSFQFPETFMNVCLREAIMARRKKLIKPLYVIFDEAPRFLGVDKNGCIKKTISESIELDARYGIAYFLAAQNIDSMPEGIQRNCKYIFIPGTLDVQSIRQVLISSGVIRYVQRGTNTAMKLKMQLKKYKYSWVVVNRMDGSMTLIRPLSPLSSHLETTQ